MKTKILLPLLCIILFSSCKENPDNENTINDNEKIIEKSTEDKSLKFLHDPISSNIPIFNIVLDQKNQSKEYLIDQEYEVYLQVNWELDSNNNKYIATSGTLRTDKPSIRLIGLNYCNETRVLTYFYDKSDNGGNQIEISAFNHNWLTFKDSKDDVFRFDITNLVSYSTEPCNTTHEHKENSENSHKGFGLEGPAHDATATGGLILSKLP
ncbi:hypothetical protein LX97_02042 [Nonlabens dokdonensis]|uniref:Lipoprotein n=2 Tax=Nonlabens dokdonensis TaxID=328515 RepID=L7WFU2_NONDD|nr:hypothetical protein [Nonlabens dokdonensis]AGC77778.1 hypothetical protein DDD_2651 [Nonlabens dokdonensis DSW-6]PZX39688.1 hypothetical protein LX97_02042 [Nonlabens dokdonensis]